MKNIIVLIFLILVSSIALSQSNSDSLLQILLDPNVTEEDKIPVRKAHRALVRKEIKERALAKFIALDIEKLNHAELMYYVQHDSVTVLDKINICDRMVEIGNDTLLNFLVKNLTTYHYMKDVGSADSGIVDFYAYKALLKMKDKWVLIPYLMNSLSVPQNNRHLRYVGVLLGKACENDRNFIASILQHFDEKYQEVDIFITQNAALKKTLRL